MGNEAEALHKTIADHVATVAPSGWASLPANRSIFGQPMYFRNLGLPGKDTMRKMLCGLLLSVATAPAWAACAWRADFVSDAARPLAATAFKGIDRSLLLPDIIARLGPASRQVGSGLYVLEWDVVDGRVFHVSTQDACGKPLAVGFSKARR